MAKNSLVQSTRTKPHPFCNYKEKELKKERTNVNGTTAEERPDTETSLSLSHSTKRKLALILSSYP